MERDHNSTDMMMSKEQVYVVIRYRKHRCLEPGSDSRQLSRKRIPIELKVAKQAQLDVKTHFIASVKPILY